ncbi:hypothetical protein PCC6311_1420 [Synechococcus elongatus PCC 6311]|nr:hypothetical protein PCC7943_1420 [Synechococcus elongatus PCC 7943]UOW73894.1 hypothetical protein PCC6311_1420 [Synechococcus elongatus PCC 6311]UOW76614.1 hypothetical protein PCC6301pg_1420 [Synechococcus elongatus PCC 6301]
MEPGSSSRANAPAPPAQRWSERVGIAIALATLVIPFWVISFYSTSRTSSSPPASLQLRSD